MIGWLEFCGIQMQMETVEGLEGFLVDTGAVHAVTGGDAVERHDKLARQHGKKVTYEPLPRAKMVSLSWDIYTTH